MTSDTKTLEGTLSNLSAIRVRDSVNWQVRDLSHKITFWSRTLRFRKTARICRLGRNLIFSSDRCPAFLLSEPPKSMKERECNDFDPQEHKHRRRLMMCAVGQMPVLGEFAKGIVLYLPAQMPNIPNHSPIISIQIPSHNPEPVQNQFCSFSRDFHSLPTLCCSLQSSLTRTTRTGSV